MLSHKIYNGEVMNVDLVLDDDPNNLYHEIKPTVIIRKFNNYTKNMRGIGSRGRMISMKQGSS